MKRWRIAALGATEVYIHPSVLLFALYAWLIGHGWLMLISILSILLHEAAHALTAAAFGHPPSALELTPLGAVMRLEDTSRMRPRRQAAVLLAGPGMTFLLVCAALCLTEVQLLSVSIGRMLLMCNTSLLLLNLLPVFPLDGGQMIALLLCAVMPARRAYQIMRTLGWIAGIGLIAANVYASWRLGGWNLSLAIAGCCVLYGTYTATTTQAMAELRSFLDRRIRLERKHCMVLQTICVLHNTPVRELVRRLPQQRMAEFVCVEAGSMYEIGRIGESQLIQYYLSSPEASLAEAIGMLENAASSAK